MLSLIRSWLRPSRKILRISRGRVYRSSLRHGRLFLEQLEERRVLSATTVTVSGNTATISSTDSNSSFSMMGASISVNSTPVDVSSFGGATNLVLDIPYANVTSPIYCNPGVTENISVQNQSIVYSDGTYTVTILNPGNVNVFGQSEDTLFTFSDNLPTDPVSDDRNITVNVVANSGLFKGHQNGHIVDVEVHSVGSVYAFSQGSANDIIYITGSVGDDTFYATPGLGFYHSPGFFAEAINFRLITGIFIGGGNDSINLVGATQGSTFTASPHQSELAANGNRILVLNAKQVNALAGSDHDRAVFYDTPDDDVFIAFPTTAWMTNHTFLGDVTRQATNFSEVYAFAGTGGHDTAQLLDHLPGNAPIGTQDRFAGITGYGLMTDDHTYFNQATNFYSVLGSSLGSPNDLAAFYATSGNNTLQNIPNLNYYAMSGQSYLNQVQGFSDLTAFAFGSGVDVANLTGGDLHINGDVAQLILTTAGNPYGTFTIRGFDKVTATKQSATDKLFRDGPVSYLLTLLGNW